MQAFSSGRRRLFLVLALVLALLLILAALLIPRYFGGQRLLTGSAPNGQWTSSSWAPSNNTLFGTAANTTSKVWFTGHDGIISTVFYPSADMPDTTSLEFLVGKSDHSWVDEEQVNTQAKTTLYDSHALAWQTVNTAKNNTYRIQKLIYSDPTRDSLIQQVTFTALKGTLNDYLLYVYYDPTLHNKGDNNSSFTQQYQNTTVLVSTDGSGKYASALAASLPYQSGKNSSGYVQLNDGLTDLKGAVSCGSNKCPDYTMNYSYDTAKGGNTAQIGLLDLSKNGALNLSSTNSVTFKLVLSFGQTSGGASAITNAEKTLLASLGDTSDLLHRYVSEWNTFDASLHQPPAVGITP